MELEVERVLPVLDKYCFPNHMLAQYMHWNLLNYKGDETCVRLSLEQCHSIQGAGLHLELGECHTEYSITKVTRQNGQCGM